MHKKVKVACRCMVAPFAQLEAPQDPLELSRHKVRSDHLVHQPGSPEVDVVITNCRKNCVASEGSKNPTYELSECQKSCPPKPKKCRHFCRSVRWPHLLVRHHDHTHDRPPEHFVVQKPWPAPRRAQPSAASPHRIFSDFGVDSEWSKMKSPCY